MTWLTEVWDILKQSFQLSVTALNDFMLSVNNLANDVSGMASDLSSVSDIPLSKFLGAFRWVVGDLIWYAFYTVSVIGIGYTIYLLISLISEKSTGGKGLGGIFSKLKNLIFG